MGKEAYLLDTNVLVALILSGHRDHRLVTRWFANVGDTTWGTCALTEAALLRVLTNPQVGGQTMDVSRETLALLGRHPSHRYWPMAETCDTLTAPLAEHLFGHRQVMDAVLLGLAISQGGVLVTTDHSLRHFAGSRYRENLLLLEAGILDS